MPTVHLDLIKTGRDLLVVPLVTNLLIFRTAFFPTAGGTASRMVARNAGYVPYHTDKEGRPYWVDLPVLRWDHPQECPYFRLRRFLNDRDMRPNLTRTGAFRGYPLPQPVQCLYRWVWVYWDGAGGMEELLALQSGNFNLLTGVTPRLRLLRLARNLNARLHNYLVRGLLLGVCRSPGGLGWDYTVCTHGLDALAVPPEFPARLGGAADHLAQPTVEEVKDQLRKIFPDQLPLLEQAWN